MDVYLCLRVLVCMLFVSILKDSMDCEALRRVLARGSTVAEPGIEVPGEANRAPAAWPPLVANTHSG